MARTFDTDQQAAVDSSTPLVYWLFTIFTEDGTEYQYSFQNADYQYEAILDESNEETILDDSAGEAIFSGEQFTFKVIPKSFYLELNRLQTEDNNITPSRLRFSLHNVDGGLTASDFENAEIRLQQVINDVEILKVRFWVRTVQPVYYEIHFDCLDIIQKYIEGDYPNNRYPGEIFNSAETVNDNLCLPETYGIAYIPIRSVYIEGTDSSGTQDDFRYYILGDTLKTYYIHAVHAPRDHGNSEWTASDFNFPQYTKSDGDDSTATDYRVFLPIINDSDSDGIADAAAFWANGDKILDMPVQLSNSETAHLTDPSEVISEVLQGFGHAETKIDTGGSFSSAATTYNSRGLEFNGGFWFKEGRQEILAELLNSCNSTLDPHEIIELRVLSATSIPVKSGVDNITSTHILGRRANLKGMGSFKYTPVLQKKPSDSGYVSWQQEGEPQDEFVKTLVAATSSTEIRSQNTLSTRWVQDDQLIQTIAALWLQKKLLIKGRGSLLGKHALLRFQPDDFVTISGSIYGGTRKVRIDQMVINRNGTPKINFTEFTEDLEGYDWDTLAPPIIALIEDTTTAPVSRTMRSSSAADPSSGDPINEIKFGSIVISNYGAIRSFGKLSFTDDTEGIWMGYHPPADDYRFNIGNKSVYVKMYDGTIYASFSIMQGVDGVSITGFSDDAAMVDDSSSLVPTQKATKAADAIVLSTAQAYTDSELLAHNIIYNHDNYDTAYGWGDHSVAGYLLIVDIDNTPIENETEAPISSGWAWGHENDYTHSDIALNTTHRSSNGTDHSYIDQDVTSGSSPTFEGLSLNIRTISSDDNVLTSDFTILIEADGSAGDVIAQLPSAVGLKGKIYNLKVIANSSIGTGYVATNGSEEIDGDSDNLELFLMEAIPIQSDNANWWIIS